MYQRWMNNKRVNENCMIEIVWRNLVSKQMTEWTIKKEWMNKWKSEQVNKWTSEWTNK